MSATNLKTCNDRLSQYHLNVDMAETFGYEFLDFFVHFIFHLSHKTITMRHNPLNFHTDLISRDMQLQKIQSWIDQNYCFEIQMRFRNGFDPILDCNGQ